MKVLGVGFGRTGTLSLKLALNRLGFGPTLHNSEFRRDDCPVDRPWYLKANGMNVPWEELFKGFQSTVDWPGVFYWDHLIDHYPDALVILTERPVREWLVSFKATIFKSVASMIMSPDGQRLVHRLVIGGYTFGDNLSDENLMRVYSQHVANVKHRVDPDRLLVFNVREGWGPLCRFLQVATPIEPFPMTNKAKDFRFVPATEEDVQNIRKAMPV